MNTTLSKMREELNVALKEALKSNLEEIKSHQEEMDIILSLDEKMFSDEKVRVLIEAACRDARAIIADAKRLFKAAEIMARYN